MGDLGHAGRHRSWFGKGCTKINDNLKDMFNLEQAISEWRKQMQAAGIKSPEPLAELESHLREDIQQQIRSGASEQAALEGAVVRIGRGTVLSAEFAVVEDLAGLVDVDKSTSTDRLLGVLWAAGCLWSLITLELWSISPFGLSDPPDTARFPLGNPPETALLILNGLPVFIYVAGIVGSLCLFRGAEWGRRMVRSIALLMLILCAAQILIFRMFAAWSVWCAICALFSLASIRLLHPPRNRHPSPVKT
jgi:hypothetical protein